MAGFRKGFSKRKFVKKAKPKTKVDKNLDRRIRKIENDIELKYVDFTVVRSMTDTGSIEYVFPMQVFDIGGDTQGRIGDDVVPTSLNLHYNVQLDDTNVTGGVVCRVIVLWDRTPGGALPALFAPVNAILDNTVITDTVLMPYVHEMRDRFKILYDHKFVINPSFATTTIPATGVVSAVSANQATFSKKIKLGRQVKYNNNATSGTIADVSANSLLFCLMSDQTSLGPNLTLSARTYFKDA